MTNTRKYPKNRTSTNEPNVQDLLSDPSIRPVNPEYDNLINDLQELVMAARKRLLAERWRGAA